MECKIKYSHGLFFGWEAFNTEAIHADLDSDIYAGSEALTLRIPLSLPYPSNHNSYERVNGVFEYEGALYRLVKQKLYNDTLYVVCSRDELGKHIKDAIQEAAYSINDEPTESKPNSAKGWIAFIKDFETCKELEIFPSLNALRILDFKPYALWHSNPYTDSIDHPPSLS